MSAAWGVLVLDVLLARRGGRGAQEPDDPGPPDMLRLLVAAALVGAFVALERRTAGATPGAALVLAGLTLVASGLGLHFRARRALGRAWSSTVALRPGVRLVTHGPYARARHPLYLAILLVAAGTALAHPSPATFCLAGGLAIGLGLKLRQEDRALRAAFGADWVAYADRVPALGVRLGARR